MNSLACSVGESDGTSFISFELCSFWHLAKDLSYVLIVIHIDKRTINNHDHQLPIKFKPNLDVFYIKFPFLNPAS